MIISASRRTDIPSYYADWFYNRVKEGFVCVRNPMNFHQVSRISLSPDVVDGIVFWTKNPTPMLERLHELEEFTYYFQFTLNSYGTDIETNVPSKNDVVIPAFQQLSSQIGKERVVWRYDPILFTEKYTIDYHTKYFRLLADKLSNYTEKCTVSFLDFYKNTQRNIASLGIMPPSQDQVDEIMGIFSMIAREHGIYIDTCAEEVNLLKFGISHARCIDKERFERIGHFQMNVEKDKNQRAICGCMASIDIGAYNTCRNGCRYCYANFSPKTVQNNSSQHDPQSPLLFGTIAEDDTVRERQVNSCIDCQATLFGNG